MKIDKNKCIGCGSCSDYCVMHCITAQDDVFSVNEDECVDCGACKKSRVCPVDAIYMPEENYEYPRCIRMQFSDPAVEHPEMKAWGRGIEHDKTNDVLGKFKRGEYCLMLEIGRPMLGVRLYQVESLLTKLISLGFDVQKDNPLFLLMTDKDSGKLKSEVLNEKIMNATIEIKLFEHNVVSSCEKIIQLLNELDTVVSVGLLTRFDDDGSLPIIQKLENIGICVRPNAKINVGLGRPLVD